MNVDDEQHCLMKCFHPSLSVLRNEFIKNLYSINPAFASLTKDCLFQYIIIFNDQSIIGLAADYCMYVTCLVFIRMHNDKLQSLILLYQFRIY